MIAGRPTDYCGVIRPTGPGLSILYVKFTENTEEGPETMTKKVKEICSTTNMDIIPPSIM